MAEVKKTFAKLPKPSRGNKNPSLHPDDEWLHEWHTFVFPLPNGAGKNDYKPKIKKYIEAWLELLNDIEPSGKKYKLKNFDIVPTGIGSEHKAVADAEEDIDPTVSVSTSPNLNKVKSVGGGNPDIIPIPGHILPQPPPPPPK